MQVASAFKAAANIAAGQQTKRERERESQHIAVAATTVATEAKAKSRLINCLQTLPHAACSSGNCSKPAAAREK